MLWYRTVLKSDSAFITIHRSFVHSLLVYMLAVFNWPPDLLPAYSSINLLHSENVTGDDDYVYSQ